MNIQAATTQLGTIVNEMDAASRLPAEARNTLEYEAKIADLISRENDAVRQLAAIRATGFPGLLTKIKELGRWRAQSPDGFCEIMVLDGLVDSIIADAERLGEK